MGKNKTLWVLSRGGIHSKTKSSPRGENSADYGNHLSKLDHRQVVETCSYTRVCRTERYLQNGQASLIKAFCFHVFALYWMVKDG